MDKGPLLEFDIAIPGQGSMVTKAEVAEIRNLEEFNWAPGNNIPGMIQELR